MKKEIEEYIKNIESQIEELGIRVNPNGSVSGSSPHLINLNADKAKELTAKLEGFNDALKIVGEDIQPLH